MIIIGIGNVLQKDDGLGVYASTYLSQNYTFSPKIEIKNGGVKGIHLLNVLEENNHILILDSISIDDKPASIYAIPAQEISGYGLNNGGAHEIGILQCMDMLELQGKKVPKSMVIGIIPSQVYFDIGLSDIIFKAFDSYISVVLQYLTKHNITYTKKEKVVTIKELINKAKDPSWEQN